MMGQVDQEESGGEGGKAPSQLHVHSRQAVSYTYCAELGRGSQPQQ